MNAILALPMSVRLAVLFVVGLLLGSFINLGAYRLAWHARAISPWSSPDAGAPRRRWSDRLPLLGWLGLRREAPLHGAGFWIRPLLVELAVAFGLAGLYWWEVGREALLPANPFAMRPSAVVLHVQFAAHAVLIALMLLGSLVDIDERLIPDAVTIPGALLGLVWAASYPWVLLPVLRHENQRLFVGFAQLTAPIRGLPG